MRPRSRDWNGNSPSWTRSCKRPKDSATQRELGPASNDQRARDSVRKKLDRAYEQLEIGQPPMKQLARHLHQSIQPEGNAYAYRPSPPINWSL